jgi:hypothetical protein
MFQFDAARAWAAEFVRWYDDEQRHSGIRCVTPGSAIAAKITPSWRLDTRWTLGLASAAQARWSGRTRDWTPVGPVTLNPEND